VVTLDRRLPALLAATAILALPAVALRIACVGGACDEGTAARADVPFCSLPTALRREIAAGYREGRSPEVLAASGAATVAAATAFGDRLQPPWPGLEVDTRVPLYFKGAGVAPVRIPPGTTLDAVAPTLSEIIGLERPHPEVRSGQAIEGVASEAEPRLVVILVATGLGSSDLEESGTPLVPEEWGAVARTTDARTGSQPLDPAAVLTTIGTGGLPRQHGITGRMIRADEGRLVQAWGEAAPVSVIATLADDLDEATDQQALIGAALSHPSDRGVIGGNWYVGGDRDDITKTSRTARGLDLSPLVEGGYGRDAVTDLFVVVLEGDVARALRQLDATAARITNGSYTLVFTGTGSSEPKPNTIRAPRLEAAIESAVGADVVEGVAAGGVFLDVEAQTEEKVSEDRVIEAMRKVRAADGTPVFADVFPSLAVSFARYC